MIVRRRREREREKRKKKKEREKKINPFYFSSSSLYAILLFFCPRINSVLTHHLHIDPFATCLLRSQAKVESVPGVVFYNQQDPRPLRDGHGSDGLQDGLGRRGGKDFTTDDGGQHALPQVAGMGWLVPGATATNESYL